jgi:hypothetical protein
MEHYRLVMAAAEMYVILLFILLRAVVVHGLVKFHGRFLILQVMTL